MTLGKATVEKLEATNDNNERLYDVVNTTKPRMSSILVTQGQTVRDQTYKKNLWLDFIVALNALRVLKNSAVV